jgi:hypothetical protein
VGPIADHEYFRCAIRPRLGGAIVYAGHHDQRSLASLVGGAAAALVTPMWDEPYGLVVAAAVREGAQMGEPSKRQSSGR